MDSDEARIWNGAVGEAWVRNVERFDVSMAPFGRAAMQRLRLRPGERVLDVGCGTGATSVEMARLVAPGEVVGVDFSAPMVQEARRRAGALGIDNARFVETDVRAIEVDVDFDVAFSRLGVMFFDDPTAAFASIRSRLTLGGRLCFVCFQGPQANPFIVVPLLAAATHLDLPALPGPHAPGPFSLADPDRTHSLLRDAGFEDVTVEPGPSECVNTIADGGLEALAVSMLEQNPMTSDRLRRAGIGQRRAAVQAVAEALEPGLIGDEVRLGAGSWVVSARNPD